MEEYTNICELHSSGQLQPVYTDNRAGIAWWWHCA